MVQSPCLYPGPAGWLSRGYTYSNERYEPCVFLNGSFFGTPEEAFELCAGYLG